MTDRGEEQIFCSSNIEILKKVLSLCSKFKVSPDILALPDK